jgi:hemerythrin
MSVQLVWNETYSVGNPEIDAQHQRMFEIANSLSEKLDAPAIKRTIMALYKHTREHFTAEEQMMKEIGYPKLAYHRELHNELITRLNSISTGSFDADWSVLHFKRFVYDWVIDHILNHDHDYFVFAQQQQKKT